MSTLYDFKEDYPEYNFSNETLEFLGSWLSSGAIVKNITDNIRNELEKYSNNLKPDYQITLYRGYNIDNDSNNHINLIKNGGKVLNFAFLSSWTYNEQMAKNFSGEDGIVVKTQISMDRIFLDTTLLDPKFIIRYCGGFPEEEEVILNPGDIQIV